MDKSINSYGRSKQVTKESYINLNNKERLREEYLREKMKEKEKETEREQTDTEADIITIESIECYARSNAEQHNTSSFEMLSTSTRPLILRRGQPFYICLQFKRECDFRQDSVLLQFTIGSNPRPNKGTLIPLPITNNKSFTKSIKEWDIRLHRKESKSLHLEIQISCKAAVGIWNLHVITNKLNANGKVFYFNPTPIYILFNPWCKDDAVYMDNEIKRKEYVLNDNGKLFGGTNTQLLSRRWLYGQFSSVVLPACMSILAMSTLDDTARGSPVKVVRVLSAMLNSQDDNGVLQGKWSEPYDDGTAPSYWTGSKPILDKYVTSGFQPVKYAQCWVYAGLFTTVCRALGIPCRPVTNYQSAHDTDGSLTIDRLHSEEGYKLEYYDSVWTYHIWNDCWMTRPDLPSGYGGWQAVDSTPQETSDGIYRAGPASLNAVKKGEIGYMYDSPFVFSEVNADVVNWQKDKSQRIGWRKLGTNKYEVGSKILTKAAGIDDYNGENDCENITEQYKNLEGSAEERLAFLNAVSHGNYTTVFGLPPARQEDVFFDMVEIDKAMIGQPFTVVVHIENKSDEIRNVIATLTADSIFYTGIKAHTIKNVLHKFSLNPKQNEILTMRITEDEYYEKLVEYSMIKIYAVAAVGETKQIWTEETDIALEKPRLELEIPPQPLQIGEKFEVSVTLKNPLSRLLQKCNFAAESLGLTDPECVNFRDIQPEEKVALKLPFVPKRTGKGSISVLFNSRQLIDVQGSMETEVP